ncbi:MAG: dockerin type I repeat-containing protein, partial [Clostridia bacterium]|nr:dockerin type I repeat-containing protein [Clostridia bacterium]
ERYAKAISYDGSGKIAASLIFPIDRTARSIGYTSSGVAVRRKDYYHSTDGDVNNITNSFVFSNSTYTRLYITFKTAQSVSNAICVANLDSTDGGITTTGSTTTVKEGAYNFTPSSSKVMNTESFTANKYTIGSLTAAQKTAFDSLMNSRRGENGKAIKTASEFAAMSASGNYYLAADITIDKTYANVFTGTLDGKGYTITTSVPLFNEMNGTVRNLTVNGNIVVKGTNNGAVSIQTTGNAHFENITVNANLSGGAKTGGIVGYGYSGAKISFFRCINNGEIKGTSHTGGLIGYIANTILSVDECINNGKMYSDVCAAGLVGRFGKDASTMDFICNITNSINNGEIYVADGRAAGILGRAVGNVMISGCINYGHIHYKGTPKEVNAGGIYGDSVNEYTSGETTVKTKNGFVIRDCYNYGKVEGTNYVGGIISRLPTVKSESGYKYIIESCGNAGEIISTGGSAAGIAGYFYGSSAENSILSRCFNVGNVSVVAGASGSAGRACGILSYTNGAAVYIEDCYNAGKVSASGTGSAAYQILYNKHATGATAEYINNNHTLAVSGATYIVNGTQANNVTTFTAAELKNGTLKKRINSGAGSNYYFQKTSVEAYPVLREHGEFTLWDLVLREDSGYKTNNKQIYKVEAKTNALSFASEFINEVKVYNQIKALINDNTLVGTGYTVTSFDGKIEKTIIVTGDIDGNGKITSTDYGAVEQYIKGATEFTTEQSMAADVDENKTIGIGDYLLMKKKSKG